MRTLLLCGVVLFAAVSQAAAGTTILVNVGSYGDANAAAHAEAKVNWLDGDHTDETVCTECFAAVELQRYLRRATGREADFAIADDEQAPAGDWIVVGDARTNAAARGLKAAAPDDLGEQGYVIRSLRAGDRRVLHLAGGGRVGTLYAAYDLLHRLGCRWFAPGDLHEVVPSIEGVGDVSATERPEFLTRGFHSWENRGDRAFLLWMARNRLNYWCVEQDDRPVMRKLGILMSCGAHDAQVRFLDPRKPYPYDHPRFAGDDALGRPKDPYPVAEPFRGDADGDGKLTYFEAHPEWFPLVKGKRVIDIRGDGGTNYCTSNRHATDEFMKNYVQALVDGPYRHADVVRFWTLDGGRWCTCPACKALGTPTDRNLLLVHRLDQAIKAARRAGKIHRPLIIRFLAYADVLDPPSRPLPEGFDYQTCSATFFPIVRSYVYAFDDARSRRNARYMSRLHGWMIDPNRHYRGKLCLGEYYNVSGYKCLPICFMHTMARDVPTYHRLGARHFHYMHCTTANMGNKALTNYQMARQLWSVKTDCEALWGDYFARRYGPAAGTMRQFYEALEKMFANVSELKYNLARRINADAAELFHSSELRYDRKAGLTCNGPTFVEIVAHGQTCRKLIDQALAGTCPPRVRQRIAEDERLFTYGERTIAYYHACIRVRQALQAKRVAEARKHLAEAVRLAELLRKDTRSTRHSSSHANASNAFTASRATKAIDRLKQRLAKARDG